MASWLLAIGFSSCGSRAGLTVRLRIGSVRSCVGAVGLLRGHRVGASLDLGGGGCLSGQCPGPVVLVESEVQQSAKVQACDPQLQPGVVRADATVGNAGVAAGELCGGSFDHGPMGAILVLESWRRGALTVFALQCVVFMQFEFASPG